MQLVRKADEHYENEGMDGNRTALMRSGLMPRAALKPLDA